MRCMTCGSQASNMTTFARTTRAAPGPLLAEPLLASSPLLILWLEGGKGPSPLRLPKCPRTQPKGPGPLPFHPHSTTLSRGTRRDAVPGPNRAGKERPPKPASALLSSDPHGCSEASNALPGSTGREAREARPRSSLARGPFLRQPRPPVAPPQGPAARATSRQPFPSCARRPREGGQLSLPHTALAPSPLSARSPHGPRRPPQPPAVGHSLVPTAAVQGPAGDQPAIPFGSSLWAHSPPTRAGRLRKLSSSTLRAVPARGANGAASEYKRQLRTEPCHGNGRSDT